MNEQKNNFTLKDKIFYFLCVVSIIILTCFSTIFGFVSNTYLREYENKQTQLVSNNDNIDTNISKKIDIKSLNENSTNVIELFNIENYFTGFLNFEQGENPTIYTGGNSIVIVGFSLNVKANIEYAFDKFYISSIDYVFKSKFSNSIPIEQLMQYEYGYAREDTTSGTFIYTSNPSSLNDLFLLENLERFVFETNTYLEYGSLFDANGIIFSNKISYKTLENKWGGNDFNTSPINGLYPTNNFFTNGDFLKVTHKPNISFLVSGISDLISSNNNKDYQIGYDKGYLDGKNDTLEEYPPIDKVNITFKYIWSTLTNATSSVLNIFDFDILPGVPLYAIIAVPIIIAIIFYVFKVIKK